MLIELKRKNWGILEELTEARSWKSITAMGKRVLYERNHVSKNNNMDTLDDSNYNRQ